MNDGRANTTATLLADGTVLIAGGYAGSFARASAELYDPIANRWATGSDRPGDMKAARSNAAAALLPDGRVLVAGGFTGNASMPSAELYDPGTKTWASGSSKPPDMGSQ